MMERTHVFGVLGSKIDGSAEWVSSLERGAPDFMDTTIHASLAALWVRSSPRCVVCSLPFGTKAHHRRDYLQLATMHGGICTEKDLYRGFVENDWMP